MSHTTYPPPASAPRTRAVPPLALLLTAAAALAGQSAPGVDPYATVEAEAYDLQSGTRPGQFAGAVGYIEDGDYVAFEDVAFGRGPLAGEVRASSKRAGGTIEFRVDAPDGLLVAEAAIAGTGGWSTFETFPVEVLEDYTDGTAFLSTRDLYLVFRGGGGFLFDVDAFSFTPADVPVAGVAFTNCPFAFRPLTVGDAFDLDAEVLPRNASNPTVFFSSSDEAVVAVDDILSGEIRAVGAGAAVVTAVALDGGFVDSCEVRVLDPPIDPYQAVLAQAFSEQVGTRPGETPTAVGYIQDGDYLRFNRVAFGRGPADGTVRAASKTGGGTIEFRVDAPDGLLVAAAEVAGTGGWSAFETFPVEVLEDYTDGTAFLSTRDLYLVFRGGGGFLFDVAEFAFTPADVPVSGVRIANCPATLAAGEAFVLEAEVSPADAVNPTVSFNSRNPAVVRVDDLLNGEITAVAPGTTTVTVTAYDGGFSDACEIEVVPAAAARAGAAPGVGRAPVAGALGTGALVAYPNPSATGLFRLGGDVVAGEADLYDAGGRLVRRGVGVAAGATVDLSDLPRGRYLLRAGDGAAGVLVRE